MISPQTRFFPMENPLRVGSPLLTLVQEDWDVFSQRLIDSERADELLVELANDGWDDDSGESLFNTADLYTRRISWAHETLQDVLEGVIRDLGEDPNDPDIPGKLAEALADQLVTLSRQISKGAVFYRGRPGLQSRNAPYSGAAIGAPPARIASAGRANRSGISAGIVEQSF